MLKKLYAIYFFLWKNHQILLFACTFSMLILSEQVEKAVYIIPIKYGVFNPPKVCTRAMFLHKK